ncbi:MAG: xanthine dehydrogenase family protein subunit M [Deltaproteobacteria bacterium]|nr:xanthine dehydrogenase family protein subunit M [Deltaproteobacteria bacterium]
MHLPKFDYERLTSAEEAGRLLGRYGGDARLVAGGTDLFPRMKYGLLRPRVILDMKGLSVKSPEVNGDGNLRLGAMTSLAGLARDPLVREKAPLLAEAALGVGSVQVRERATLGGNICLETRCLYYNQSHTFQFTQACFKRGGDLCYLVPGGKKCLAVFCADTVPALISLGASIGIGGPGGVRRILLEKFYTGDAVQPLAISPTELVTEVIIPARPRIGGEAFAKFSVRGGVEFAAVTAAVALRMESDGATCSAAVITVGAVSPAPRRARKAEEALQGKRLSPELFGESARIAAGEISPLPHHGFSAPYLRECLEVQIRRALEAVAKRVRS